MKVCEFLLVVITNLLSLIIAYWWVINNKHYKLDKNNLLRIDDEILIKVKELFNKLFLKMKKTSIFVIIFICIGFILKNADSSTSKLVEWFGSFGVIVLAILFYVYAIMITTLIIMFINTLQETMSKIIYGKRTLNSKKLFSWLAEDMVSHAFLYSLFNEKANWNDIKNIMRVKEILKKNLNNDITEYKLFRNHLDYKTKKSFSKKFNLLILTSISSFATINFLPKFYNGIINVFLGKIESIISWNNFDGILFIFNLIFFVSMVFIIYFTFYYLILMFTDNGRRVNYLISILDILIEEKGN